MLAYLHDKNEFGGWFCIILITEYADKTTKEVKPYANHRDFLKINLCKCPNNKSTKIPTFAYMNTQM